MGTHWHWNVRYSFNQQHWCFISWFFKRTMPNYIYFISDCIYIYIYTYTILWKLFFHSTSHGYLGLVFRSQPHLAEGMFINFRSSLCKGVQKTIGTKHDPRMCWFCRFWGYFRMCFWLSPDGHTHTHTLAQNCHCELWSGVYPTRKNSPVHLTGMGVGSEGNSQCSFWLKVAEAFSYNKIRLRKPCRKWWTKNGVEVLGLSPFPCQKVIKRLKAGTSRWSTVIS